ncbi:uncharacterized protein LTR77_003133 [Saxophila tyrrhenica]|uniref:Uncharacterized protein n=1 Tax=Saxophila tyrrhenica TaxID=1690608 RepID=A0AAV9PHH9_9PEZI|nr:hypothetical protein LTR77_003133 [Saxophila tyrrhenica]
MPLSATQMRNLALAWQCFETEPKVDYDKFHRLAGLASAHSARELLRVTKKKLREEYGDPSSDVTAFGKGTGTPKATPSKATPKKNTPMPAAKGTPMTGTGKKRGRKAAGETEGDGVNGEEGKEDGDDEESPSKKAKNTPKVTVNVKKEKEGGDDDFGFADFD